MIPKKKTVVPQKATSKAQTRRIKMNTVKRQQSEAVARASESLLRSIAENYPNSYISIIEKDLTIGYTAGQEFKKLNLDPNQFVGLTLEQVFGKHTPLVRENYLKTFGGVETQFEISINNQHQSYRTVPLRDQAGRITRILAVVENVTERKRAEEALRFSEERYRNFIGQSFEAISRTEFDHPIDITLPVEDQIDLIYENAFMAECNQAMADMYHVPSPEAFIGMRLIDAHGGKDNPVNRETFRKLIENGYKSVNDETMEYTVDGKPIWFLSNTIGMVENGTLVRLWGTAIDITEQKLTRDALEERTRFTNKLLEATALSTWISDAHGTAIQANPACYQFFGATEAEVIGKYNVFQDNIAEQQGAMPLIRRAYETGESVTFFLDYDFGDVSNLKVQNATHKFIKVMLTPILDAQGQVSHVVSQSIDLTEIKRAEDALSASEERFRGLITSAPDAVLVVDEDGKITFVNTEATNLLGYTRDEFIGMDVENLIPQKSREGHSVNRAKYMSDPRTRLMGSQLNLMAAHKDGSEIPVDVKLSPVKMEAGTQVVAFMRDITERKQVEVALRKSEEKFAKAFRASPTMIVINRVRDGYLLEVNESFETILGYTREEALGHTGVELGYWVNPAERERMLPILLATGSLRNEEILFRAKSGEVITGLYSAELIEIDGEKCILSAVEDITERKRAEEKLIKAKEEAEESETRFRKSLEFSPTPIALADYTGKLIFLNQNFIDTYGYTLQDIPTIDQWMLQAYPDPEYRNSYLQLWEQDTEYAIKNNTATPLRECLVTCRSNEVKTVAISAFFEKDLIIGHFLDISEHKQAEEALRLEQAFVNNALDTQPDTFFLFDFTSGKALRWNRAFREVSGYSDEEIAALPTPVSYYSAEDLARENAVVQRIQQGESATLIMDLICKDGRTITTEYQAAPLKDEKGDYRFIIAIGRDITERKQAEEMIHMRLRLLEFANDHSIEELLQKALDEICLFTNSPIGFYHFIEPDQKTVSLQAWSTRTLTEFCRAQGKGMHYDIDQAGVWVDCVHQRKPVIHNDYVSLPHRKGLPLDHAEVKRELVVPILRDGNVVSILGIGNKPSNYNEKDSEYVSYVADIVWTIVERKQVAEALQQAIETLHTQLVEIHALKETLQEQAIRDPLTNLHNRRYLNEMLEHEVARAKRENYPISIMMIDIDYFKNFNDTYGHSTGDGVLKSLSSLLVDSVRQGDIACRYGGEEFLVVMIGAHETDVERRAQAICRDFSRYRINFEGLELSATVSIGVAFYPKHGSEIQQIISSADAAMYQAKQDGRNRVHVWEAG